MSESRRTNRPAPSTARDPQHVMGLSEVTAALNMARSNVRKYLERHDVEPLDELAVGPVWSKADIDRLVEERALAANGSTGGQQPATDLRRARDLGAA